MTVVIKIQNKTKTKKTKQKTKTKQNPPDTKIPHIFNFLNFPFFFCHNDNDAADAAAAADDDDHHDCDDSNEYDNCWGATYWNKVCHISLDLACNHGA